MTNGSGLLSSRREHRTAGWFDLFSENREPLFDCRPFSLIQKYSNEVDRFYSEPMHQVPMAHIVQCIVDLGRRVEILGLLQQKLI